MNIFQALVLKNLPVLTLLLELQLPKESATSALGNCSY